MLNVKDACTLAEGKCPLLYPLESEELVIEFICSLTGGVIREAIQHEGCKIGMNGKSLK